MPKKENHVDDAPARTKQLLTAGFVLNHKESAFIKKTADRTYYMPFIDIDTMADTQFDEIVAEASKLESIGGEIEDEDPHKVIEGEVIQVINTEETLTSELQQIQAELEADPKFQKFVEVQGKLREVQAQSQEVWARVQQQMEANDIKSIKGDWGSITVAEKLVWKVADIAELPAKFVKKVPDTTKLSAAFKLNGEPPKGAKPTYTHYLTKRFKKKGEQAE